MKFCAAITGAWLALGAAIGHAAPDDDGSGGVAMKCEGTPTPMAPLMAFDDPYAPKGKCYTALISDQWGDKQWIDENTILLMTVIPGTTQGYSTVFMDPRGHLRFGHRALVIGTNPTSYTAVSGAQTVAPVFIVLKYLD